MYYVPFRHLERPRSSSYYQYYSDFIPYDFEPLKAEDLSPHGENVTISTLLSEFPSRGKRVFRATLTINFITGKEISYSLSARDSAIEATCKWRANDVKETIRRKLYNGFYDIVAEGLLPWIRVKPKTSSFIRDGINLGTSLQKKAIASTLDQESGKPGSVKFDLILEKDDGSFYAIGFVGSSRMYNIRDPYNFFQLLKARSLYEYGKQFSWNHNLFDLSAEDRDKLELYHTLFLRRGDGRSATPGHVPLTESSLTRLLLSYEERGYLLNLGREQALVKVERGDITLEGEISQGECGSLLFLAKSPHGRLYHDGERLTLFLVEGKLIIAKSDFTSWFHSLSLGAALEKSMVIEENDIALFAAHMLPALEHVMSVSGREHLPRGVLPEKGEYRFVVDKARIPKANYWDEGEDDAVSVMAFVSYGEKDYPLLREEGSPGPGRDLLEEARVRFFLKSLGGGFVSRDHAYVIPVRTDDELFSLVTTLPEKLSAYGNVTLSKAFREMGSLTKSSAEVSVSVNGDLLDLTFHVDEALLSQVPAILEAYRQKRHYYRVKDSNAFIDLENDAMREVSILIEQLGLKEEGVGSGSFSLPSYRAMYLDAELKSFQNLGYSRSDTFKSIVRAMKGYEDSGYAIPSTIAATLRHYQESGYRWLRSLTDQNLSGILADDMGLGKTLQTLSLFAAWKEEKGSIRALVVAPASLLYNWKDEGTKFAPSLSIVPVVGTQKEREALLSAEADVFVASYDQVRRTTASFAQKPFDFVVLDEAQNIKNGLTKAARSVKMIGAKHRLALTGTPVQNKLSDLWSIFDFLMPGYLFSSTLFKKKFEDPISHGDKEKLAGLQMLVSPFILRRMKSDVLKELPEKNVMVRKVVMGEEQKKLYQANLIASKKEFRRLLEKKGLKQSRIEVLALLTKLRQLCCDPRLAYEDYKGESAKREQCMDLLREAISGGHSVLLFSQFTTMLDLIESDVKEEGISYFRLDGSTDKEDRHEMTSSFQSDETNLFLISLKAGGLGLNLTKADTVILYDPWWNVAAEEQAMDRVHRIGQKSAVQVYRLIASGTIEEKILDLQEKKSALSSGVLSAGEEGLSSLSEEEWLALFD